MQLYINLLIGLLIGLFCITFFKGIREGAGPMVGSIMFPTMYQGKTDVTHKPIEVWDKQDVKTLIKTDVTEKHDERVDKDVRAEHWHEEREDEIRKKDKDVIQRKWRRWDIGSQRDCHEKKKIIFDNYNAISNLEEGIKNFVQWMNDIFPSVHANERNAKINAEKLKNNSVMVSRGTLGAFDELRL